MANGLKVTENNQLPLMLPAYAQVYSNAMTIAPETPIDKWADLGIMLGKLESMESWAIGDWYNHAKSYKDADVEAIISSKDWAGPKYETCRRFGQICTRIPREERRETLSFSHHRAVAGLPIETRNDIMDAAEKEAWPTRVLLEKVAAIMGRSNGPTKADKAKGAVETPPPVVVDGELADEDEGTVDEPDTAVSKNQTEEPTEGELAAGLVDRLELVNRQASVESIRELILGNKGLKRRVARLTSLVTLIQGEEDKKPVKRGPGRPKGKTVKKETSGQTK